MVKARSPAGGLRRSGRVRRAPDRLGRSAPPAAKKKAAPKKKRRHGGGWRSRAGFSKGSRKGAPSMTKGAIRMRARRRIAAHKTSKRLRAAVLARHGPFVASKWRSVHRTPQSKARDAKRKSKRMLTKGQYLRAAPSYARGADVIGGRRGLWI